MCHESVFDFFQRNISKADIFGKSILEVGSRNINGSVKSLITKHEPESYLGVDLTEGSGVDLICDVCKLNGTFGKRKFDVVITTEMLEHVPNWKDAIQNLKRVVKSDGLLVITTRSYGFPYHEWPGDHWRYEISDFEEIFDDMEIIKLESDTEFNGIFLIVKKPKIYKERELDTISLYNMATGCRVQEFDENISILNAERWEVFNMKVATIMEKSSLISWASMSNQYFTKVQSLMEEFESILDIRH